jgi:hypothetical protein
MPRGRGAAGVGLAAPGRRVGDVRQPLRPVRETFERNEDVQVEVGMRRSTAAALYSDREGRSRCRA